MCVARLGAIEQRLLCFISALCTGDVVEVIERGRVATST